ncbi:hypothetical protein BH20ACI1_BH20ACI1_32660 [soil metagenome]
MITIRETKEKMNADKTWWKVYFYDFVDDFRYHKNLEAVSQPFVFDNNKFDALLASTVEALCAEMKLKTPDWTKDVPACEKPFFVAGFENLKATAIVESPLPFRIRKVFVTSSFLHRV